MSDSRAFDLVVIGGGTAALAAVSEALDLGVERIATVEKRKAFGGECALNACVPTKTMLTTVKVQKTLQEQGAPYGIYTDQPRLDFQKLMAKVQTFVEEGGYPFLDDKRITLYHGEASFISKRELRVGEEVIRGEKIIIASGSEPIIPPIQGLKESGFLLFHDATHLEQLPESLIIIGGGPVGVEFAQFFQWFGCQVTLIEKNKRLLKEEEPEISAAIEHILKSEGVNIYTECNIEDEQCRCEQKRDGEKIRRILHVKCQNTSCQLEAEQVLVAVGMKPRIEALNLTAAGVDSNTEGIIVNDELQTSCRHIWAIGDVVGPYRFTHVADYQAVVAVQNALSNAPKKVDYHAVPWAIFTEPTVAHVGITEEQAREQYQHLVVLQTPVTEASRYRIESLREGFIKLIVDGTTDQILGGHLLANNADDIIHTLLLAIQYHMTVQQVLNLMYIYPAKAQIIQKALETYPREKARQYKQKAQTVRTP